LPKNKNKLRKLTNKRVNALAKPPVANNIDMRLPVVQRKDIKGILWVDEWRDHQII
jgi:hypothetical protein